MSALNKTQKRRPAYSFTQDYVSDIVPTWKKLLRSYKDAPDVRYLEIGVDEGRSLLWMLENILTHPSSKATAIDSWINERFRSNLLLSGLQKKIHHVNKLSQNALRELPPKHFDIVYIDGAHRADCVLTDAILAWGTLKDGGIMMFDDYHLDASAFPEAIRPALGIRSFVETHINTLEILSFARQVAVRKLPEVVYAKGLLPGTNLYTRIGKYAYFWRQEALLTIKDKAFVPLTEQERYSLECLLKCRAPMGHKYIFPAHLKNKASLTRVINKLKIASLVIKLK